MRRAPQDRRRRGAVGQRRAERAVEHDRRERAEVRVGRGRLEERGGERLAARPRPRRAAARVGVGQRAERLDEPGVDLGLGQHALGRRQHRLAQVEHVVREVEVEERRLPLLELRLRRQHVVGQAGGLGHRDVDHDDQLERLERLAHPAAVGERVRRVAALDEHRPVAARVVGEDLVGDHVARHEPADDLRAGDRRHVLARALRRACRRRGPARRATSAGTARPACRSCR